MCCLPRRVAVEEEEEEEEEEDSNSLYMHLTGTYIHVATTS